jgi:CRISPR/Cas system-associated exonuclease Cas4 (RecB family)
MIRKLIVNNDFLGVSKAFNTKEFGEKLEAAYLTLDNRDKFTTKKSFAPSSVGYGKGNCPRYWFYAFNGVEFVEDNDALSKANMMYGTEAGKRIAALLDEAGLLIEAEVEVKHEDPPIGGFMDALVMWQDEEIICEVKTTKQDQFSHRAATMKVPTYQLIQLLTYMKIFKKDKGFFLTENKNTGELLIVPIKMTKEREELIERVWAWMREVHDNAINGELPTRPFTQSSFECKSCPVKKTCWEGYKRGSVNGHDPAPGVVDLPPLTIPK